MRRRIDIRHHEREEKGEQISQTHTRSGRTDSSREVLNALTEQRKARQLVFRGQDLRALIRRPPARAPLLGRPARRQAASDVSR